MKKLLLLLSATVLICSCEDFFTPEGEGQGEFKEVPATSIKLDLNSITIHILQKTETLVATVEPSDATDRVFWESSDNKVASVLDGVVTAQGIGSAVITATAGEFQAECTVVVGPPNTKVPEGAVDLGIVVVNYYEENGHTYGLMYSLYWADRNIGANAPEGYGNYYSWGEVETKSRYDWSTYKWGGETSLTKYNYDSSFGSVDSKTLLDMGPEGDDVASRILGGSWRIPTTDECMELCTQCIWEWKSLNGVNGYRVTGPNGNSIFLPASGVKANIPNDDNTIFERGERGYYWTSCLVGGNKEPNFANAMNFSELNPGSWYSPQSRSTGLPVRAVAN